MRCVIKIKPYKYVTVIYFFYFHGSKMMIQEADILHINTSCIHLFLSLLECDCQRKCKIDPPYITHDTSFCKLFRRVMFL